MAGAHTGRQGHGLSPAGMEVLAALVMTAGRGRVAALAADLAGIGAGDRLVDVGCGPGRAVREAARRGAASATGVDPSPVTLRLGRLFTALRGPRGPIFVEGSAEKLPLPDGTATVVWALSSVHHWSDRALGLSEAWRVLAPGGRLLLAERDVTAGARGHARHGLTPEGADDLVAAVAAAGFADVERVSRRAGRRTMVVVTATRPGPGTGTS